MTGNAINAKSEALELYELSSEGLDCVSGGTIKGDLKGVCKADEGTSGGQNDAVQMFQQILQQLTGG